MAMDYPDAKDWSLYYAQSVSLTRFLVEQGPPEQFVQFVRNSQQGVEVALRDVYQIGGLAELQERWLEYARRQMATLGTSRPTRTLRRDRGPSQSSTSDAGHQQAPRLPARSDRPRSTRCGPTERP